MPNLSCVICTEMFTPTSDAYVTTCGHIFHHICLLQWMERSKTCPQCRIKCTNRNIFKLHFNLANLDSMQEKLDNNLLRQNRMEFSRLQLKVMEHEIRIKELKEEMSRFLADTVKGYKFMIQKNREELEIHKLKSKNVAALQNKIKELKKHIKTMDVEKVVHSTVITLLEQEIAAETELNGEPKPTNDEVVVKCLKAVNSLTNKQPDLFDAEALAIIIRIFNRNPTKEDILCLTLQWLQKACIKHGINRQNIVNADIMKHLKPLINNQNSVVLRDVLALLRYLVLDDDIRVEQGKGYEHAKIIAAEVIVELTKLLPEFNKISVLGDLMLTIGVLAVREEFCTAIEDAGGIQYAFNIIRNKPTSVHLSRGSIKLLHGLAGNYKTKLHLIQKGVAPIIKNILELHMLDEPIANATLDCISSLTMRVGDNIVAFYETGIAETIVETLRTHRTSKWVQYKGALAIRNIISRSRKQCDSLISFGVEDLLNEAMIAHPTAKEVIEAALIDLRKNN